MWLLVQGIVTEVLVWGCFMRFDVDVGNGRRQPVSGLVHNSELTWQYCDDARTIVKVTLRCLSLQIQPFFHDINFLLTGNAFCHPIHRNLVGNCCDTLHLPQPEMVLHALSTCQVMRPRRLRYTVQPLQYPVVAVVLQTPLLPFST